MLRLGPGEITILHPMIEMTSVNSDMFGIMKDILGLLNRVGMTTAVMINPEDTVIIISKA